ncbi:unnamed protein product (macronuclear) [Paramecium tetraurelia]|uniref:Uncharacterized protein n=1 Tax=Paramecium tetraurelia TaxID=5888 RepID=A0BXY5_PARTE|nr:uncharacterized protein GSPATT00033255001 [Paramecium tetraurelia]CAK63402.1 unnamed protein product [Paramecium tetraurelia]|eukprot:XP_001430800.1 hypothetical protein (macronuclear) [Paramecium tetraurelia strain d4-2]
MQQTVSLIAGMTKVFNSANITQQYSDVSKSEKENSKGAKQNKNHIQELTNQNSFKENDKENVLIQNQISRK